MLYESHTDGNAFDVFYRILESYMAQEINIRNQELERQKRYHQFQLDTNFEKVRPAEDYLTSGTMLEFLERGKRGDKSR